MNTSEQIKELCREEKISVAELARRIGQTPQNFNKKLKRDTISTEELILIGNAVGARFGQVYYLKNGSMICISNQHYQF